MKSRLSVLLLALTLLKPSPGAGIAHASECVFELSGIPKHLQFFYGFGPDGAAAFADGWSQCVMAGFGAEYCSLYPEQPEDCRPAGAPDSENQGDQE